MKKILPLLGASLLLGTIPSLNHAVLNSGVSAESAVFFTYLTMAIGAFAVARFQRISFRITARQFVSLVLTGTLGMGMTGYLLNLAYGLLPVGLVTMLHFLYPAFVALAMAFFFKQRLSRFKLIAVVLSLCGMAFIADFRGGFSISGIGFALLSALTYAYYMVSNEKASSSTLPLVIKLFFISCASACVFGLIAAGSQSLTLPPNFKISFLLFGVVGGGSLVAFYLISLGISRIGAASASFFNTLEPMVSLAISALVYGQFLSRKALIGCFCVILSVFIIALGEKATSIK